MVMKAQSKCLCSLSKVFPATAQSSALPPLCESFQMMFVHRQIWCHCNPQAHLWRKKKWCFQIQVLNKSTRYLCSITLSEKETSPLTICFAQFSYTSTCSVLGGRTLSKIYGLPCKKNIYTGITQIKLINFNYIFCY